MSFFEDLVELIKQERETRICLAASFAIALVLMVPELARSLDFDVGFVASIIRVPATGLAYCAIFFHEIGHTLINWIFGYAALPSFDFKHGGGMTYNFARIFPAMFIVDALLAGLIFWLRDVPVYRNALAAALAIHLALGLTDYHEVLILFMGHGLEIGMAGFFLYRALTNYVVGGTGERYLNGIFGFYFLFTNMHMDLGLMLSDIHRIVYEQQKGSHGFGDLSRIADMLLVPLEAIAAASLVLCIVTMLVPVPFYVRDKAQYMDEEDEAPRDRARRLRRGQD